MTKRGYTENLINLGVRNIIINNGFIYNMISYFINFSKHILINKTCQNKIRSEWKMLTNIYIILFVSFFANFPNNFIIIWVYSYFKYLSICVLCFYQTWQGRNMRLKWMVTCFWREITLEYYTYKNKICRKKNTLKWNM